MFIVDSTLPQHKPLRRKIRALENYRDYFIAPQKRVFICYKAQVSLLQAMLLPTFSRCARHQLQFCLLVSIRSVPEIQIQVINLYKQLALREAIGA